MDTQPRMLRRFFVLIDAINEGIGNCVNLLIPIATGLALLEVILRYIFNSPTIWIWDTNVQLLAIIVFLGGGYHLLHGTYIRVDVLYVRFPNKIKLIADVLTLVIFVILFSTLIWKGWEIAWESLINREHMSTIWRPPFYHIRIIFLIGSCLMMLQGIATFTREIFTTIVRIKEE